MKIFMLKFFIIVSLMFISVLAGMQMANDGIHKMKLPGNPDSSTAVMNNEIDNQLSSSMIGSHDLQAKKKKLEEMNAFNFFSSMGRKMSEGITKASENAIQKIMK